MNEFSITQSMSSLGFNNTRGKCIVKKKVEKFFTLPHEPIIKG